VSELHSLVERQYELVARGAWERFGEVFDPGVETVEPESGAHRGIDAFVEYNRGFHEAFPDGRLHLVDVIAESGDTIVVEGRFDGTHAESGRRVELDYCDVFRARGGLIVYHRVYFDRLALLEQLERR
jgi:ketosteroid isomerase-like protein